MTDLILGRPAMLAGSVFLSLLVSACSESPQTHSNTIACDAPRPEVCSQQFEPVCASKADGSMQSYPNACFACRYDDVNGYSNGECE